MLALTQQEKDKRFTLLATATAWKWLAENPGKHKRGWPGKNLKQYQDWKKNYCFLCVYRDWYKDICLLGGKWGAGCITVCHRQCFAEQSPFGKWYTLRPFNHTVEYYLRFRAIYAYRIRELAILRAWELNLIKFQDYYILIYSEALLWQDSKGEWRDD
jgi:(2Fe-2S) ferredoxin